MSHSTHRAYLGDGVYVEHDGYALWLTTEDGLRATNRICLVPEVMHALDEYRERLRAAYARTPPEAPPQAHSPGDPQ